MKHKHHKIPRHAGGTDDPSNIIELTVEEHAAAHKLLFEQFGRWQDELAWKALSGQIGKEELIRMKLVQAGKTGLGKKKKGYTVSEKSLAAINKNRLLARPPSERNNALKGDCRTDAQKSGRILAQQTRKQRDLTEKERAQIKARSAKGAAARKGLRKMFGKDTNFVYARPGTPEAECFKNQGYKFKGEQQ